MDEKKYKSNLHAGHRSRMRARFEKDGFDAFSDHECLEFILYNTMKRVNTNETAHELINKFGSIKGVLDAAYEDLITVKGVGDVTAKYLTSLNSQVTDLIVKQLGGTGEFDIMNAAVTADWVIGIPEAKRKIIVISCVADGSMKDVLYFDTVDGCDPRRLVDFIIDNKCEKYVLFLENSEVMSREEASAIGNFTKILGSEMIDAYYFVSQRPVSLINSDVGAEKQK